jgi:hypothetical protein
MPFQYSLGHAFISRSIRAHAPAACGVYGISNRHEWLLIGSTHNIQAALLEYSVEGNSTLTGHAPTGFNFEVCDPSDCDTRQQRLIREYHPVCNS